ncbi:MAG: hypothetical protein ACRD5H_13735, partial [Nitrososphaerales archaeon]
FIHAALLEQVWSMDYSYNRYAFLLRFKLAGENNEAVPTYEPRKPIRETLALVGKPAETQLGVVPYLLLPSRRAKRRKQWKVWTNWLMPGQ